MKSKTLDEQRDPSLEGVEGGDETRVTTERVETVSDQVVQGDTHLPPHGKAEAEDEAGELAVKSDPGPGDVYFYPSAILWHYIYTFVPFEDLRNFGMATKRNWVTFNTFYKWADIRQYLLEKYPFASAGQELKAFLANPALSDKAAVLRTISWLTANVCKHADNSDLGVEAQTFFSAIHSIMWETLLMRPYGIQNIGTYIDKKIAGFSDYYDYQAYSDRLGNSLLTLVAAVRNFYVFGAHSHLYKWDHIFSSRSANQGTVLHTFCQQNEVETPQVVKSLVNSWIAAREEFIANGYRGDWLLERDASGRRAWEYLDESSPALLECKELILSDVLVGAQLASESIRIPIIPQLSSDTGMTLRQACELGDVGFDKVMEILALGRTSDLSPTNYAFSADQIALMYCVREGKQFYVEAILEAGGNLYIRDTEANTVAHHAVLSGHSDVLEPLCQPKQVAQGDGSVKSYTSVDLLKMQNMKRITPLTLALNQEKIDFPMIQTLLRYNAPLMLTSCKNAMGNKEATFYKVDESWSDTPGQMKLCSYIQRHPLCIVFAKHSTEIAELVINKIAEEPNEDYQFFLVSQALYIACLYQREDLVHLFLDYGDLPVDLPLAYAQGQTATPLHVVLLQQQPNISLVTYLLQKGADINLVPENLRDRAPQVAPLVEVVSPDYQVEGEEEAVAAELSLANEDDEELEEGAATDFQLM